VQVVVVMVIVIVMAMKPGEETGVFMTDTAGRSGWRGPCAAGDGCVYKQRD